MKLVLLLLAIAMAAQTIDRTKPPRTPPLAPYKLPPVFDTSLPNGMEVLLVEDRRFPLVTARLNFGAGSKFEPGDLAGLAETTAALLKEGTKQRTSRQIAEELAAIGGAIGAGVNSDALVVSANGLSEHLPKLLDIVADVVRNATFPDDEVNLRKQNRKEELNAQRAESSMVADEKFYAVVFGKHPYGRILPTAQSIDRIGRTEIAGYRDRMLAPNNAVLILLGDLPPREEVLDMIRARFAGWQKRELAKPPAAATIPATTRKLILIDRPGSVQADVRVGRIAVTRANPEYLPLAVGSVALGGGASSRIFTIIREEKGYAYDAHTELQPRRDAGAFYAVTQVRNEVVEPGLTELLAQMKRMAREPAASEELGIAKNYMSGTYVLRLETQNGLADQLSMVKTNGLPLSYLETYTTSVQSITPQQVESAARKYISPEDAAIVVVGDVSKIGAQVEKLGKVTIEKAAQ